MYRIIDLSIPVDETTPIYPGDPTFSCTAAGTIAADGFNVSLLKMGSHFATHCDAPYHFVSEGRRIDELPLERFVGHATVIHLPGLRPRQEISWSMVHSALEAPTYEERVLIRTDWSTHRGTREYFDHPFLSADACAELLASGVRTFGIDAISIDPTPTDPAPRASFPCHLMISEADGVIIENLRGLAEIPTRRTWLSALPLRLTGADGAPTRAVAIEWGQPSAR